MAKLAKSIDFRSFKPHELFTELDNKIVHRMKSSRRTVRASLLFMVLLFMSVSGVTLELSLLGLTIQDIEKVKEFVVVAFLTAMAFSSMDEIYTDELKALKRQIFIKKYGAKAYDALSRTFPYTSEKFNITHQYVKVGYYPIGLSKVLLNSKRLSEFSIQIVSTFFMYYVLYVILNDIWVNPSINPIFSRILVVLVPTYLIFMSVFLSLSEQFTLSFINIRKAKKLIFVDGEHNHIDPDFTNALEEILSRKKPRPKKFKLRIISIGIIFLAVIIAGTFFLVEVFIF